MFWKAIKLAGEHRKKTKLQSQGNSSWFGLLLKRLPYQTDPASCSWWVFILLSDTSYPKVWESKYLYYWWIYIYVLLQYTRAMLQIFILWGCGKVRASFLPYKLFADRTKCGLSKEGSNKFMIFDVVDLCLLDSSSPVDSYCSFFFPHWLSAI